MKKLLGLFSFLFLVSNSYSQSINDVVAPIGKTPTLKRAAAVQGGGAPDDVPVKVIIVLGSYTPTPANTNTPTITLTPPPGSTNTFTSTATFTVTLTFTPTAINANVLNFPTAIPTPTIAALTLLNQAGAFGSAGTTEISTNTTEYDSMILVCSGLTGAATISIYETGTNPVTGITGLAADFTFDNSQASWAVPFNTAPIGLIVRPVTIASGVTAICRILGRPRQ